MNRKVTELLPIWPIQREAESRASAPVSEGQPSEHSSVILTYKHKKWLMSIVCSICIEGCRAKDGMRISDEIRNMPYQIAFCNISCS